MRRVILTIVCCAVHLWLSPDGWGGTPPLPPSPKGGRSEDVAAEVDRIIASMKRTNDLGEICKAAEPLKALGSKAVPSLLRLLREAPDEQTRFCAIVGLGTLGPQAREASRDLFQILVKVAGKEEEPGGLRFV